MKLKDLIKQWEVIGDGALPQKTGQVFVCKHVSGKYFWGRVLYPRAFLQEGVEWPYVERFAGTTTDADSIPDLSAAHRFGRPLQLDSELFRKGYARLLGVSPFAPGEVPARAYIDAGRRYLDQFNQPIEGPPQGEVLLPLGSEWYSFLSGLSTRLSRKPDLKLLPE